MTTNNIFDFFGIDLDATLKNLNELKENLVNSYTDKVNEFKDNFKKYDLNTQEGYEAFIKEAADIRKQLVDSNSFGTNTMLKVLDRLVEKVMNEHENKVKNMTINEVVNKEVERTSKNPVKLKDDVKIEWPSTKLTYKQARSVRKLVDEFVETMIEPYVENTDQEDILENVASGLYEFGAWVLTKEDE